MFGPPLVSPPPVPPPSRVTVGEWTVVFTSRADGNFAIDAPGVQARRARMVENRPCVWLRQGHGVEVIKVLDETSAWRSSGSAADAAFTTCAGIALNVVTADCAPIAMVCGAAGAVVHAGWKGLLGGIIERTATELQALSDPHQPIFAFLGPCIHPTSYEFGDDLEALAKRYGEGVRGRTDDGAPALDMPATVAAACEAANVNLDASMCEDTAQERFFSHRVRQDCERQALFLWRTVP